MKPTSKVQPTKQQILSWVSSVVPASAPKPSSIEELGNGIAYLHLLQALRPGSVRSERINNKASTEYEIKNNLKMLSVAFDKLQLPYVIEIDKLAQMKYQDNYHLAVFMYRLEKAEPQNKDPNQVPETKQGQVGGRLKIVLGKQAQPIKLVKQPPPILDKATFQRLKGQIQVPQQIIERPVKIDQAKSQKLDKIASVLHLQRREKTQRSIPLPPQRHIELYPNTIQESYKRFLRPSICQRSKYLKEFTLPTKTTFLPSNPVPKSEENTSAGNNQSRLMDIVQLERNKSENENNPMLLSQTKEAEEKGESEATVQSITLLEEIQKQKEQYKAERMGRVEF